MAVFFREKLFTQSKILLNIKYNYVAMMKPVCYLKGDEQHEKIY